MKKRAKKLFIPEEENNYAPDILQRVSIGVMLVLVVTSFALANLHALIWMGSHWMVSAVLPSVLIDLTNEERVDESLSTLRQNDELTEAANLKAEHMAENEYFAHYSPDGTSPWYWFDEAGYEFVHAGENLAVHFTDSEEVVEAWMESPSHKENIMNGLFTEIGIGTAEGEYKGYPTVYVVQLFGAPAAPTVAAESTSAEPEPPVLTLETERETPEEEEDVAPITFETIEPEEEEKESVEPPEPPEPTSTEEDTSEDEVDEVREVIVIQSELSTTSRDAVPAAVENDGGKSGGNSAYSNIFARSVLIPGMWLQTLYIALALFVFIALILSIAIEWRRQHPVQIAYGTGLIAVMATLFYVHTMLTSGVIIA